MSQSNSGRSWPLSIIGIFIFLAIMLFGILYISLVYVPVNKENVYLMDYQQVDKEYNDIVEAQGTFDKHYAIAIKTTPLSSEPVETMRVNGEKVYFEHAFAPEKPVQFDVILSAKQGDNVNGVKVTVLLTRYETGKYDQTLEVEEVGNGVYRVKPFTIAQAGRWKIIVRVAAGEFIGYAERGVFAQ